MKDLQAPWVGNHPDADAKPDRCESLEQCPTCKGSGKMVEETTDFGKSGRAIRTRRKTVTCWGCDGDGEVSEFGEDCECDFCLEQRRENQRSHEDHLFDQWKEHGR